MITIKITIPEGFEVDTFDKKSGELTLKAIPVNIRKRLKGLADVFAFHGTTKAEFEKSCKGLSSDEVGYRKEKLIVAAYNENKFPDWSDGTAKLYPIFNMPNPSGSGFSFYDLGDWSSDSYVGSRQVFIGPDAYDNLMDAVKKFLPEYQQSRTT